MVRDVMTAAAAALGDRSRLFRQLNQFSDVGVRAAAAQSRCRSAVLRLDQCIGRGRVT